ncbi:DNA primase [Pandoraea capi]|uniref:DNA primase n=1 Tax=Pandoraea capi TaxID=2508286 RepID=A0ABY6W9E4_9BURK|nr:CHC2 zinc finger domain-containing protein [Pandoraea capi]VVE42772.1 DNA primase [Pandoraea capi]
MDRYNIGDLLTKVPLEDVALRLGMQIERRGAQTRSLCPFHQDTRPSLNLFTADGNSSAHYHCFACGAHGNAIELVKQVQGVEFLPAVQWIAQQFGIQSPRNQPSPQAQREATSEIALNFALRIFNERHDNKRFETWCEARAFDADFLHGQGLRCITRGVLVDGLRAKNLGEQAELIDGLEGLGLIKRLRSTSKADQLKLDLSDQFQDCFHDGRVVIPIRNTNVKRPEVVGFAGRALLNVPPEGVPKYLLTSGFEKSKHLFNASVAFAALTDNLKNERPATLYLVEGFLDALRLQALGHNSVALMGISLGKGQFELLRKFSEDQPSTSAPLTFCIFLDNDPAGFGGTERLVRELMGLTGVNLRWVGMPWRTQPALGKDPDSSLRDFKSHEDVATWLQRYDLPAEAALLVAALGSQDTSELQDQRWGQLAASVRERAVFRTALAVKKIHGRRSSDEMVKRLEHIPPWAWANELQQVLSSKEGGKPYLGRSLFLDGEYERAALARTLAYHGARRGELPCDEEVWLTLGGNARLFDQIALNRLRATIGGPDTHWRQAAPYDAVNLPRKLAFGTVLNDPRRKVMPHPADLHLQQLLLNELLTQRHDRLSASGQTFSASIPAVRWYASRQEVMVTGPFASLNEPDLELGEPATLSFGYQIDMDVLEGDKAPSDQGMFRPFGQCWREFMANLAEQCHAIGPRVHVLRLDAERYYDAIQRYVVRDALLQPLRRALAIGGVPQDFANVLGLNDVADPAERDVALERLFSDLLFGYEFRDPQRDGSTKRGDEAIGIPQGPVLSAYIGTIALFPVDDAARQFMRRTAQPGTDGLLRPRAGYARYVDDIVLFADSEALLTELRETLQSTAAKLSITLIQKGDRVRTGSPTQVMRQLNEGRGLAASVPAWEPPLMGDGEAGWGLGEDMPTVDRQCALKMLRHPALMASPERIEAQVKAAMLAPDLRPNDLGLCARWLWWQVTAEQDDAQLGRDGVAVWRRFWELWDNVCEGHDWADAFKLRGYHWLYAVEGLDKLLDPNPWQENDQTLTELPKNRVKRQRLAVVVCQVGFFDAVRPAENFSHVRRRARLVARKARRLAGTPAARHFVEAQHGTSVTAIEWLCLAAERISAVTEDDGVRDPLASIKDRNIEAPSIDLGDRLALDVCQHLGSEKGHGRTGHIGDDALALAIDFVLSCVPRSSGLDALSRFPNLLVGLADDKRPQLIPHLPVAKETVTSLYAVDAPIPGSGRHIYRYSVPPSPVTAQSFVKVVLNAHTTIESAFESLGFEPVKCATDKLAVDRSSGALDLNAPEENDTPTTLRAARLFEALLVIHRTLAPENDQCVYVPFRPQLFTSSDGEQNVLRLLAEPVDCKVLGVNAWFHDHDDRVRTVNVPKTNANLWRVGWAVADVLGVAGDMAGETGHRDEQWADEEVGPDELPDAQAASQRALIENYVLRQQLRKLQGAYISEAQIDATSASTDKTALPSTVTRALTLLRSFPADQPLDQQVRHLIIVEAETRAMALRLQMRGGGDLRKVLHQVFPEVLTRLPLWALQGLQLEQASTHVGALRPELALMLALYKALDQALSPRANIKAPAPPLRVALALAATGIGLRGSVAALWGLTAQQGSNRMPERLNIPVTWDIPDMARLDPQHDYSAMRKWLQDADWPSLCRASPWHWMLALIGLLDANFPQAFDVLELKQVYSQLSAWQSEPGGPDEADEPWPFDALPRFTSQRCDALITTLPCALRKLDELLGLRVVRQQAQQFRRNPHSDEFTDASNASWQISKPQFTSLGTDGVEKQQNGRRLLSVWSETRSIAGDDLVAVHTLDFKLGQWKLSASVGDDLERINAVPAEPAVSDAKPVSDVPASENTRAMSWDPNDAVNQSVGAEDSIESARRIEAEVIAAEFSAQQVMSRKMRSTRSESSDPENERASSHFRVALFQWRVDDSYKHPIAEVGLGGLPLGKSAREELRSLLNDGDLLDVDRAAKRGSESRWAKHISVVSWPEHRRRVLIGEALKACHELGVHLLVLPEVSIRSDTIDWLKDELRSRYKGLAVLAGTFREFSSHDELQHLQEKLTLLWKPDDNLSQQFGLDPESATIQFQRAKKYRAVAAHELFRPSRSALAPLYTEDNVLSELSAIKREEWSGSQINALINALVHESPNLRYCMELICSELFLLTSPANRRPLVQEFARMMKLFFGSSAGAEDSVSKDIRAIGEWLSVVQAHRERRSVLLVPACTSRSNDYWHAGQASVLASGTATVFCNAVHTGIRGGSCFIGIDSVARHSEQPGVVHLLTPYHGWQRGILQANGQGALSERDQALVVVDLDPIHVVSGKPRPQLLPEPMSLVAYLPVVEVMDRAQNAKGMSKAMRQPNQSTGQMISAWKDETKCARSEALFHAEIFPDNGSGPRSPDHFFKALSDLRQDYAQGVQTPDSRKKLDVFSAYFSDPGAVRERFSAWQNDRHQQPGFKASGPNSEPAWLDFLVADLTCKGTIPTIEVPPWLSPPSGGSGTNIGDAK